MFSGSIPALVTPFAQGRFDEEAFAAFVEWQILSGSSALVPCGTTGEAPTLPVDEHHAIIRRCVEVANGRVPVIAGCGSNDTATALDHLRRAADSGADAALVVTPYYNRPSQDGLIRHYEMLADASVLPIVLYIVPGRTGVSLAVDTVARLARHQRIVGIKDATGDLGRVSATRIACGEGFVQLSGNDDTALGFAAMGGEGCISVTANVAPDLCAALQAAALAGDLPTARALQHRLYPLHSALFADNSPAPAKYALSRLGRMRDEVRPPLGDCSPAARAAIDAALAHAGLLERPA
ncbi:MAG: 4-hydroxy-tetrahydrodipicolinate synthase [Sphingomonadaceae bacterium]|nr:4-hydroxy-tetrahydrodipicolinate synthase [Sphingomonadaceae bacterium]